MKLCVDCRRPLPAVNKSRGTRCACGLVYPHDLLLRYTDDRWNQLTATPLGDSLLITLPAWLDHHLQRVA